MKRYLSKDSILAIGAFVLFAASAAYYNLPEPEYLNLTFGWEYGNIAEALVNGRGYSDAFGLGSGSTAWMPPLYVLLLAGAFYLFGVKSIASMIAILLIKYIALAASLYFLLTTADQTSFGKYKYILALVFIASIYVNQDLYFKGLHDEWLILFLACSMLSFFTAHTRGGTITNTVLLGILAFLVPLASPALSAAFLLTWTGMIVMGAPAATSGNSRWRAYLAILAVFTASTLLWTARNYQVFGTFIPLKSNFWFDFYQANYLDEDGLLTTTTFAIYHPIARNEVRDEYFLEQESRFIATYKARSFEQLRADPSRVVRNIGRRAMSAFVFMHYSEELLPVTGDVPPAQDVIKLGNAKLISIQAPSELYWISLTLSEDEFKRRVEQLDLTDEAAILQNWREQRDALISQKRAWKNVSKALLLSLVPSFSILFGLLVRRIRREPVFLLTIAIYLTYLSPYVLVAHYRRYQVPLIGFQSVLMFLVISLLLDRFLSRRTAPAKTKP